MGNEKELIWTYWSLRRQNLENNYSFFEDGTILHHYDKTMKKINFEEYILPSEISEHEKDMILTECEKQCSLEVFNQIKYILKR